MFLKLKQFFTDKITTLNVEKYTHFCESRFQEYKAVTAYLPYLQEKNFSEFYTNFI